MYALELLEKLGFFICDPTQTAGIVLTFDTYEQAEAYRWTQDVLVVMGTRVNSLYKTLYTEKGH
jgi:hypothetical protein